MNPQNRTNQTLQARCDKLQKENIALTIDNHHLRYRIKKLMELVEVLSDNNMFVKSFTQSFINK